MFKERISVVAPAYNEQGCIKEFVERVYATLKSNNLKGEILVVNDCSKDRTLPILKELQKDIPILKIVSHRMNRGLTSAMITGIENAAEEYIVFLSSDLESHPEEDIPKLLAPINDGYDLVVGWRTNRRQGFLKTVISKFFNLLSSKLFDVHVHDLGWVKAFKKDIYYNVEALRSDWHRFFVILASNQGYKIKEVPTRFYPRKSGKSSYGLVGLKRLPGGFFDLLVVKFLSSFSKKPMHIFGLLGLLMLFFGFISGLYLLYLNYIVFGSVMDRIPLIMLTILLFLTGLQLFAMGFLAELIVSVSERKKR